MLAYLLGITKRGNKDSAEHSTTGQVLWTTNQG